MSGNRKIYFAGSIRGGRQDADLYLRIVEQLKAYGTVLTEHVASPTVDQGNNSLLRTIVTYVSWIIQQLKGQVLILYPMLHPHNVRGPESTCGSGTNSGHLTYVDANA